MAEYSAAYTERTKGEDLRTSQPFNIFFRYRLEQKGMMLVARIDERPVELGIGELGVCLTLLHMGGQPSAKLEGAMFDGVWNSTYGENDGKDYGLLIGEKPVLDGVIPQQNFSNFGDNTTYTSISRLEDLTRTDDRELAGV